jgi:protein ImuB
VLERDRGAEANDFEPVVVAIEGLVPRVEVVEPGLVYVPIQGAFRYYGGEGPLTRLVVERLRSWTGAQLGVARGPFAARRAAAVAVEAPVRVDDDASFLAGLPVDVLPEEDLVATFRWLGIRTLGELSRLPRGAMASRFGEVGLAAHRLASGEDRMVSPRGIPDDIAVEQRYEEPLQSLDQAGFAARALAGRLVAALEECGAAPYRVEVSAEAANGSERSRVWRSSEPLTEHALTERVWWQLRAWIESAGVPGGIVKLRLQPADLSDAGRQLSLEEDTASQIEAARALHRAQTLVGPDAVLQARLQGGRRPSEQVSWYRWGEEPTPPQRDPTAPWHGRILSPTPSLIPPEPQPIEVEWDGGMPVRVRLRSRWEMVTAWAGPWSLTGRWWEGERSVERYQVVTAVTALLCEVRDGAAYVVGVYD